MSDATPDQCPQCGKPIVDQQPPVLVDGKVSTVAMVTLTHPDNSQCLLPGKDVPWLYQRPPVLWKPPTFRSPPAASTHQTKLDAILPDVVDGYLHEIQQRLAKEGLPPIGIVIGIMHDGETSATWLIDDQALGDDGKPALPQAVAHRIARDLVGMTAGE